MAFDVPISVSEIVDLVRAVTNHTRPTTDGEIFAALNYGQGKLVRAALSVRPQFFSTYLDNFALVQGIAEYDIGVLAPSLARVWRLTVPGTPIPPLLFRYRTLASAEYEAMDGAAYASSSVFFYDILTGLFPGTPLVPTAIDASNRLFTFGNNTAGEVTATYPIGSTVYMPNEGDTVYVGVPGPGVPAFADHWTGMVTGQVPGSILVNPAFVDPSPALPSPIPMRTKILRLSPTPGFSYTGRLYYDYRPVRIRSLDDLISPWIGDYRDCMIAYALEQLLAAVNDSEAKNWGSKGDMMRAEVMQDLDPLSGQQSESVGSGLLDD